MYRLTAPQMPVGVQPRVARASLAQSARRARASLARSVRRARAPCLRLGPAPPLESRSRAVRALATLNRDAPRQERTRKPTSNVGASIDSELGLLRRGGPTASGEYTRAPPRRKLGRRERRRHCRDPPRYPHVEGESRAVKRWGSAKRVDQRLQSTLVHLGLCTDHDHTQVLWSKPALCHALDVVWS
jgi:hypothetical protein